MDSLKDRIIASGQTITEVAGRARTPAAHLYNILAGVRRPKLELAEALETACRGVVRWDEFLKSKRMAQTPHPSDPHEAA